MHFWKPQLALGLAAAAILAMAVLLFVRRGVVDLLLMILVAAALIGMYLLRRYARAQLVYIRHAGAAHRRTSRFESEPGRTEAAADRVDRTGSGPPTAAGHRAGQRTVRS
jgi:hypothetical protein